MKNIVQFYIIRQRANCDHKLLVKLKCVQKSSIRKDKERNNCSVLNRVSVLLPCVVHIRIKTVKGIWWMPWYYEPMKDVIACEKPRGAGK
jgi:hypothetical protein